MQTCVALHMSTDAERHATEERIKTWVWYFVLQRRDLRNTLGARHDPNGTGFSPEMLQYHRSIETADKTRGTSYIVQRHGGLYPFIYSTKKPVQSVFPFFIRVTAAGSSHTLRQKNNRTTKEASTPTYYTQCLSHMHRKKALTKERLR